VYIRIFFQVEAVGSVKNINIKNKNKNINQIFLEYKNILKSLCYISLI